MTIHVPVLLNETVSALAVKRGGVYIDGTFGRGGHSRVIAGKGGIVLGIDRDEEAIAAAGDIKVVRGRHGDILNIARENGIDAADGVLLDLGVSSPQLDESDRGFSFMHDGPLDMRMDRRDGMSAADIVNGYGEDELVRLLKELGEEPRAKRIAKTIVERRRVKRFEGTLDLAETIVKAVGRTGAKHPATRAFQALRMEVNDEVGELKRALAGGMEILKSGGRFAVITFESITDKMVKHTFANHAGREISLQAGGSKWEGELPKMKAVTRKAVTPSEEELNSNPRSRSAKLRVMEKE